MLSLEDSRNQYIHSAKLEWEKTVDSMPDSIAIIDKSYRIVRLNKTMRDHLGAKSYREVLGEQCHCFVHSADGPPDFCPHAKLMQDGNEHIIEMYNEKFGGHCEVKAIPYKNDNGALIGSIHIIRNINDRVKSQQEKDRLVSQRLQSQKLESVGQLASGIAHEINTPTQFIGSNVSFLEESFTEILRFMSSVLQEARKPEESGLKDSILNLYAGADWEYLADEIPSAIQQTKEGVNRISSIVRAMKEFSHPGSKSKIPTSLNHLIKTTVTVARNEWKYVSEIELELDDELPEITCLVDEMGQVILNLLVNAAHAISEKIGANPEDEKGVITISTAKLNDGVELRIKDTGTGIPENAQARIFDPFYTTKKVGKGTGQGLAITHDVVTQKHCGNISFVTEQDVGTEFILWLPIRSPAE